RGSSEETSDAQEDIDLLDAWIGVAPFFRPVDGIVGIIVRARATAERDPWREDTDRSADDDAATLSRQCHLFLGLAITLDELRRWDDADSVRSTLRSHAKDAGWWYWAQSHAWRDALAGGEVGRAEARFKALCTAMDDGFVEQAELPPVARVALADGYLRI